MGHDFKDCLASDILDMHRKCLLKCLLSFLLIVNHKHLWLPSLYLAVYTSLLSCVVLYIDVRRFKVSQLFPLWLAKGLRAALYCHQTQVKEQLGSEFEPGTQVVVSISFICILHRPHFPCLLSFSFVSQLLIFFPLCPYFSMCLLLKW